MLPTENRIMFFSTVLELLSCVDLSRIFYFFGLVWDVILF